MDFLKTSEDLMEKDFDVIGIGSVVLDIIFPVDKILGPESKGLLHEQHRMLGGVVLNHLSWASSLGLKAGVFGVGADDADGAFLRQGMDGFGIDHSHFLKSGDSTAVAWIYVDPKGGRCIYMNPGATAHVGAGDMAQFRPLMRRSHMLSTEISQLKLPAVLEALKLGAQAGCRTFLDLDLPPSQAVSAGLGTAAQLGTAIRSAHVLKSAIDAAAELVPRQAPAKMALALHKKLKKKAGDWVALTAGASGSALSDGVEGLFVPAVTGLKVKDSTGAGDAFFGGILAAASYGLKLKDAGLLANAAGAANVTRLGATAPMVGGAAAVIKHYRGRAFEINSALPAALEAAQSSLDGPLNFARTAVKELGRLTAKIRPESFEKAVHLITASQAKGGRLHVTGIGKPEHVARYIASSFSSTGTPCFFLHGTEAVHGSSGQVNSSDIVIAISNSGKTAELKAAVTLLKGLGAKIIGVSGKTSSWLASQSDVFLFAGVSEEGGPLNLAPRASILAEVLILSALGVALQESKNFTRQDFKKFHPGGALGEK
jgi:arabinose-5-phosphate isomerase